MEELNADQSSQLNEFTRIMNQIEEAARNTSGDWDGDGKEEFATESEEFQTHFEEVRSAFMDLINAGDETSEAYNAALTKLRSAF
ncbi:hypothetical protein [Nocardiopsis sp. Huas11]|uniref:hypothetical protein n=1 Tax=Nocardiopsis sp. Huas11 TaxID=2183912 RepID=UPI000EAF4246|nr:hypothetical protein [Nocardiopsis sp. Huas11]